MILQQLGLAEFAASALTPATLPQVNSSADDAIRGAGTIGRTGLFGFSLLTKDMPSLMKSERAAPSRPCTARIFRWPVLLTRRIIDLWIIDASKGLFHASAAAVLAAIAG
jgi:hypothetical protein